MNVSSPHTVMPFVITKPSGKQVVRLVFIIHSRGQERLKEHDPMQVAGRTIADLSTDKLGDLGCCHLHDLEIEICYEENEEEFRQVCIELKDTRKIMDYLRRGYKILPEDRMPAISLGSLMKPLSEMN